MSPVDVTRDWPSDIIAILPKLISTLFNDDVLDTGVTPCWRCDSNAKPLSFYGFICRLFNNIISTDGCGYGVVRSPVILRLFICVFFDVNAHCPMV